MKDALARMFSSAKVWTVIIGGLVTAAGSWLASHQLEVSDAAVQQFAATAALLVGILVHAQGKTDQGKEVAKINAKDSAASREIDGKVRAAEAAALTPAPVTTPVAEEKAAL